MDAPLSPIADRLGPCRLVRAVGTGGMGTVYMAEMLEARPWAAVGATVAVKVLHPEHAIEPQAIARFRVEAEIGRAVVSDAVVRTLDAGTATVGASVYHYLVLEYVVGHTFRELIDRLAPVAESLVRHIGAQIAHGLESVHAAGAVHRDLKPSNVIIDGSHRVKLMDMGIAQLTGGDATVITQDGHFVGTPTYAAPEQFGDGAIGPEADLYSLGVMLYEALTGANPFAGPNPRAVMRRQLEHVPARAGQVNPGLTPFLEEVVARLLEKDPARRFASAGDVARVLEQGERSRWWHEFGRDLRAGQPGARLRRPHRVHETAMVGRETELTTLLGHYEQARLDHGRVVVVEGEAGVGKSRLVDELLDRVERDARSAVHLLRGASVPGGADGGSTGIADAIVAHFGEADLRTALGARLSRTQALAEATACHLLGLPPAAGVASLPTESLPLVVAEIGRSLAAERPVIWVLEDLHFASHDARRALVALARQAAELPFLLLLTTRPPVVADVASALASAGAHRQRIERLSPSAVVDLVRVAVGSAQIADRLGAMIARKSDGNPLFVLAILRDLRDKGLIQDRPDGSISTREVAKIEVPDSVGDMILERVGELPREDRALLDAAAVSGFEIDIDLVTHALGRERLDLLQSLAEIERRHRLVRATGAGFSFDHHLLAETLYRAMPAALRAEYHARFAQTLTARLAAPTADAAVSLASHALHGGQPDLAVKAVSPALEHLLQRFRNEQAFELSNLVLALPPGSLPETVDDDARLARAECWKREGRQTEYVELLEATLARARGRGDRPRMLRALITLGIRFDGRPEEAMQGSIEALALAVSLGDRRSEGRVRIILSSQARAFGRLDEAVTLCRLALDTLQAAADHYYQAAAAVTLGALLQDMGRFDEANDELQRGLALATESGNVRDEHLALHFLGHGAQRIGDFVPARRYFKAGLTISRESGYRYHEMANQIALAEIAFEEGDVPSALARVAPALDWARGAANLEMVAYCLGFQGQIATARGELEAAFVLYEQAVAEQRGARTTVLLHQALVWLARCHLELGERDAALALFLEAADLVEECRLTGAELNPLPAAYLALLGQRDPASIVVPESLGPSRAAEVHLVLHLAGAAGDHLATARSLLERLSSHLSGEQREVFWRHFPIARRVRAAEAEHQA